MKEDVRNVELSEIKMETLIFISESENGKNCGSDFGAGNRI